MHARGGLKTEYLSDEWMKCIETSAEHALKLGMNAWAYDEKRMAEWLCWRKTAGRS